ncbi:MAG: hypothetical protein PHF72_12775 [Gammaproteobacteria bacterium]|nr:hypothetical protein [Gammaproteobacteria bacterium]
MNGYIARRARRALVLLCALLLLISTLLVGYWPSALDWSEAVQGISILFGIQEVPVREKGAASPWKDGDAGATGAAPDPEVRVRPAAAPSAR